MSLKRAIKMILPPYIYSAIRRIHGKFLSPIANNILYSRLKAQIKGNPEISRLFGRDILKTHYVYEPMRNTTRNPDLLINQIRYYRLYEFFKKNYPSFFDDKAALIDIGDTSGTLLKAMGRKGICANINPDVVDSIRRYGIKAEVADVESLPFKDKSFDFSFCFQCLEHVSNPIAALKELGRVTKNKIFVSIPYVENTVIYEKGFWERLKAKDIEKGGWSEKSVREVDCHKFEFSTPDFKKIISQAELKCIENFPINYFRPLGSTRRNYGSYFNLFILESVE